jgi:5-methylcytosine-specific restriction endonuclease McrA
VSLGTPNSTCALCGRPLGKASEKHHIVPKSKGGRDTVTIHPICHRKIHKVFTRTELARLGTIEALKDHPDMQAFIKWIARKPPDFYRRTR